MGSSPIERLKQSWADYVHCPDDANILAQRRMEYLGHCRNCMGDLLRLVDAAGKMTQYVSGENSDSCFTRDFNALCDQYEALAKLKEEE